MSFGFSATGNKATCLAKIRATGAIGDRQCERMKAVAEQEVLRYPDDAESISVSVSGHVPGDGGGSRTLSISISGTVKARAATVEGAAGPAVVGTLRLPQASDEKI